MQFFTGFDINVDSAEMDFSYGDGVFGPVPEKRKLDSIRSSLRDPVCEGPETVYSIVMDVGRESDRVDLVSRNLLYGAVLYAGGRLGDEPIRSQGHIHAVSASCGMSTPEVYEIWSGKAFIYMQETAEDNPGRCFAVSGEPGDIIVVPPGWAHATISADPGEPLVFGAWCVRDYGFDYRGVKAHKGLAYYPLLTDNGEIDWAKNGNYSRSILEIKKPESYGALDIESGMPIYEQYLADRDRFMFVPRPQLRSEVWRDFIP